MATSGGLVVAVVASPEECAALTLATSLALRLPREAGYYADLELRFDAYALWHALDARQ
jgi:hypothetical protein